MPRCCLLVAFRERVRLDQAGLVDHARAEALGELAADVDLERCLAHRELPIHADVIGKTVKLRKQGREYVGLSPFNKEKSPSFFVNDEKGQFFGIQAQIGKAGKSLADARGRWCRPLPRAFPPGRWPRRSRRP